MNFLIGGRLGDSLHQMWVIANNPGRHDIYITDRRNLHSDGYVKSLDETIEELIPILNEQPWFGTIQVYDEKAQEIHFGEGPRNLNMWRRYAYSASWTSLLAKTFGLVPNGQPWIKLPKITGWEEKIVFHCSVHAARRGAWNIPIDKYNDHRAVFVGNAEEYRLFGYTMPHYEPRDLFEHINIINSCKFFVGNQSAPLAMAHAMGVNRLAILNKADELGYKGEENWHKNFYWISDSDFFFEGINY